MATEVGTAYITIYPQVSDTGSRETEGKLNSLGTSAKGLFKTIAGAAITKSIYDLGKACVDAYGEWEQLSGGMQKIFDEVDYSTIAADAQSAYKTMGMSANEYMDAMANVGANFASTMGDQRGYDTAKKGMQAIADFASGTGKSVDELNQKYQLITKSTSSYQSIADQFAGVLPATSKAFLEQAQNAGYLSDEYESLTEVPIDEYQEALTSMLEDGVDGLGLLGNTAAEAEGTLTGSFNAMKSAWENLQVAIAGGGDQTIEDAIRTMVQTAGTALQNLLPIVGNVARTLVTTIPQMLVDAIPAMAQAASDLMSAIGDALPEALPQIAEGLVSFVESLVNNIVDAAPLILDAAVQMFEGLVDAIPVVLPFVVNRLVELLKSVIAKIPSFVGRLLDAAVKLFLGFVDAIGKVLPQVLSALGDLIGTAIAHIPSFLGEVIGAAFDLFCGLARGAADTVGNLLGAVGDLLSKAVQKVASFDLFQAGWDLIQGLINGMEARGTAAVTAAGTVAAQVAAAAKAALDEHSPSRVFREIGVYAMQGFEIGINKGAPAAIDEVKYTFADIAGLNPVQLYGTVDGDLANRGTTTNLYIDRAQVNADAEIQRCTYDLLVALKRKGQM